MITTAHLERLFRRIQGMFQISRVSAPANDAGPVQTAQQTIGGTAVRDAVPVIQSYGYSAVLPVGTDAIMLSVSGDASNGVILGSVHQQSRPRNLATGQVCVYSLANDRLLMSNGRGVIASSPAGVSIRTPDVEISNILRVGTGATGTFSDPSGLTITVRAGIITSIR